MTNPFKIVFFDIDWTLYDHKNHCWPASALSSIHTLQAEGIKVVLCTARPFHSMMYPPGIPLIVPGEVWTKEIVERVKHYQDIGIKLLSGYENRYEVVDTARWNRFPLYEKRLQDYYENRKTLPTADGYHLPFEGLAHKATVVLIPYRQDTWREKALPAQNAFTDVIKAIAQHEKVVVGINPSLYKKLAPVFRMIPNVEPISIRYNDAWARDNMNSTGSPPRSKRIQKSRISRSSASIFKIQMASVRAGPKLPKSLIAVATRSASSGRLAKSKARSPFPPYPVTLSMPIMKRWFRLKRCVSGVRKAVPSWWFLFITAALILSFAAMLMPCSRDIAIKIILMSMIIIFPTSKPMPMVLISSGFISN